MANFVDEAPLFSHLFSAPLIFENESNGETEEVPILDYSNERRALKELLENQKVRIRWNSESANSKSFINAFSGSKILHFTGHGKTGSLAFEDDFGKLKFISRDELFGMCGALSVHNQPECVFLCACFAQTVADAFVDLGIKHVITVTSDFILDKASVEFTDSFYGALLKGKSVSESFNLGFARIYSLYPTERDKFHLKGSGNHEQSVIATLPGAMLDVTSPPASNHCHSPAMFFVGRQTEMQQIYGLLKNQVRLINIYGPRGIGKTEIALKVAQYAEERNAFTALYFIESDTLALDKNGFREESFLRKMIFLFQLSSACFPTSESISIDSVVEEMRLKLRNDKRIRQRMGEVVSIIVTSLKQIDQESWFFVAVNGLPPLHASELFVKRSPRELLPGELKLEGGEFSGTPIQAFARTQILTSMQGNPRVIELVSKELQRNGVPYNLLRYETSFKEDIIPNAIKDVNARDMPVDTWEHISDKISYLYNKILGADALDRPLTESDFQFFYASPIWENQIKASRADDELVISLDVLDNFFEKYLKVILEFLKKTSLWGRPQSLLSFTHRTDAANLLRNSEPGTFLIGVSQTEPCLVINTVTASRKVNPVKVKMDLSTSRILCAVEGRTTTTYSNVEDLINSTADLQFVYGFSGVDKRTVFSITK